MVLPAALSGITSTLSNSLQKDAGDAMPLPTIIGIAPIGGSIGGVIGNLIGGSLVRRVGSWIGGVASAEECRAALAWGSVPQAVCPLLLLGLMVLFDCDLFRASGLEEAGTEKALVLIVAGLAQIVLAIWSAVLMIKTVAEVRRFSAWKAMGTFVLLSLVAIGIILLNVVAVFGLMAVMKP